MAKRDFVRNKWRYILTTAAFFQLGGILSPLNAFGRLFTGIQSELNTTAIETGWIGSLAWSATFLSSPLATVVESYIGYRLTSVFGSVSSSVCYLISSFMTSYVGVLIFLGVLYGLSANLVLHATLCAIFKSFTPRYQSKATGFAMTGISLATIIVTLAYEKLVLAFGWRFTLQVTSVFSFLLSVPSSLFIKTSLRPTQEQQRGVDDEGEDKTSDQKRAAVSSISDKVEDVKSNSSNVENKEEGSLLKFLKTFRRWRTWFTFFAILFPAMCWAVYWINIISYFGSIGVRESDVVIYVSIMTSFDLAGRLCVAFCMNRLPTDTNMLIGSDIVFVFVTVSFVLWPIRPVLLVCSAFIGVGRAWYNIFPMKTAVDLSGTDDTDQGITLAMLGLGVGFAVGTLPAGAIFDATSSYTLAFVLNAVLYLVGASLLIVLQVTRRKPKSQREQYREDASYDNKIEMEK